MNCRLRERGKQYDFCPKKSSGLAGRHFYVPDPHTFDEAGTQNVARAHSPTPEERAVCFANRKRSETSKTEDMAAFCLEINRPLRWHATIDLQEAADMAKAIGRRKLFMRVLILSGVRLFSKIINERITKIPLHSSPSVNETL